ncbi:regulatory protein GemA [Martelella mediterranea]|uniref:Uncharacterized protein DUF1018 n=1 Tax=Martelella mediterranea TaxID=293089 RepID=A0A4R3NSZ9_9HYPH|nr:regulatory protein GemA [Martelella mediterranea]TCT39604.1 uncharacterized protein DUF1018 [Martelella mediterranea]
MTVYRTIHAISNKLGLDDEARRGVYQRVSGKPKLTLMNETERQAVADELKRLDDDRRPDGRRKLTGPFAPKLQALWIAAWNLGIVSNRDDKALLAFVKRQTGIDHTRFLYYGDDAAKAIEALKGWMTREADVDWHVDRNCSIWRQADGYRIAMAQWFLLKMQPENFWPEIWSISGHRSGDRNLSRAEWITVMNALGSQIRGRKG